VFSGIRAIHKLDFVLDNNKHFQAVTENLFERIGIFSFNNRRGRQGTLPTLCMSAAFLERKTAVSRTFGFLMKRNDVLVQWSDSIYREWVYYYFI
jgi:hypothetical protein